MPLLNQFSQPIGQPMTDWAPRQLPGDVVMQGAFCRLEPMSVERHAKDLYDAFSAAPDDSDWTYLFVGPFHTFEEYLAYAKEREHSRDPKQYAIVDNTTGKAIGSIAFLRIDQNNGSIEVGHVIYSRQLKQTAAATEAQFLMMQYALDTLRYRRYEWKCDSLNAPSRKAAERLGFTFEGIFRQAVIYRGRSRDTAWYAIIDSDWPKIRDAFTQWLAPDNFDKDGRQVQSLSTLRTA